MRVIPPIAVTPAMLTYSSVPEPDASVGEISWSPTTSYAAKDRVIRTSTHRVYERLVAGTTAAAPENDSVNWFDVGPTNKWAMFDLNRSSQTLVTGAPIVVKVAPGRRINAAGLVGLGGAAARIEMRIGPLALYDKTTNLQLRRTLTWLQYLYGAFRTLKSLVRFDLPMSAGAELTVTVTPVAGVARCGGVVLGMSEDLGIIIDEPVSDQLNFSKVDRDQFAVASLNKLPSVPENQHTVQSPAVRLDRLRELRKDLDATVALWSGVDDRVSSPFFDTLLIVGFPRKWTVKLRAQYVISDLTLEEI